MGWTSSCFLKPMRLLGQLAVALCVLSLMSRNALAQGGGTTDDLIVVSTENQYLRLDVGLGRRVAGYIGLYAKRGASYLPLLYAPAPKDSENLPPVVPWGTRFYVRVNGGLDNLFAGGWDYVWGDRGDTGDWIQPPIATGNTITASWVSLPFTISGTADLGVGGLPAYNATGSGGGGGGGGGGGMGGGGGGGGGGMGGGMGSGNILIDGRIQVDMVATLMDKTCRFQFTVRNLRQATVTNVGALFVQDVGVEPRPPAQGVNGLLRLPGQPYIKSETLLTGSQIPRIYEAFTNLGGTNFHSIRGTLKGVNSAQTDPTVPTRFAYGSSTHLNYDLWDFQPDPTINLIPSTVVLGRDPSVGVYWDPQGIAGSAARNFTTYVGWADNEGDFGSPLSLQVDAPRTLGFETRADPNNPGRTISAPSPNPFTIRAIASNLTSLGQTALDIGPVSFYLDLPKGLTTTDPNPFQLSGLPAGGDGTISWNVRVKDGTDPSLTPEQRAAEIRELAEALRNGRSLTYRVTATPRIGSAKVVERAIEVPAPSSFNLIGSNTARGLFQMVSFPLTFGNALPSQILGLSDNPPDFDLVRYNSTAGFYEPVNTFTPGQAYWIRSRLPADTPITLDISKYPPLPSQVQPGNNNFTVTYNRGWNQVGNPYLYGIRFSDIQVYDPETLTILDAATAASPLYNWILPAVYYYDTSDLQNPQNWSYVLQDQLGFTMLPYGGYWVLVRRPALQFIFNGVDSPGAQVTSRSTTVVKNGPGAGLGRGTNDNWRLRLKAQSDVSADGATYIGVAPKASDNLDAYKYDKPPTIGNQVSLEILGNWQGGSGRYGQDLRSPTMTKKTWELLVRTPKPNQQATISWPEINASVPRGYQLTLIDPDTNTRRNLRTSNAYVVTTGADATRKFQIVAEPTRSASRARIATFEVVPNGGGAGRAVRSVTINYTFTQEAQAQIVIRGTGGRAVRTLVSNSRAADNGDGVSGSAIWDLKDQKGVQLPSGVYNVELLIQDGAGGRMRQTRPFLLTR